jgi:hypothetical protein
MYRYLFAFDAVSGQLNWAYVEPKDDLVAASDERASIVGVSSGGDVVAVDATTGAAQDLGSIGQRLVGATFDADGFKLSAPGPAQTIEAALNAVVWDPDSRFLEVKEFAVDALAKLPGSTVSADLLKLVEEGKTQPDVLARASAALVARKDKDALPLYLKDLAVHWDYIQGTQPHAVAVLAQAVATLDAQDAVPSLITQLQDPANPTSDVTVLAQAIAQIGSLKALPALRSYLLEYRADPLFGNDPAALNAVADGLLSLGGPEERALLRYVAKDSRTLPKVRAYIEKALSSGETPASAPASQPVASDAKGG